VKKVVLGLSGGVDSAVAAMLLGRAGYDVTGLYLDIGTPTGALEAQGVADSLGIPLVIVDIKEKLEENVCKPFVSAYLQGRTPNPCIMCNPSVKFRTLCDHADEIGAEFVATGHYARIREGKLLKGPASNDQSYMLCRVTREQLSRLVLPLGEYEKTEIRKMAAEMGLSVASKPDSMEICFIPDGDYAAFIEARGEYPPEGNFVDESGKILGIHKGIHHYTMGQRRGLGIALGKRMFVSALSPETNEVVLSEGDGLYVTELRAGDVNWQQEVTAEKIPCTVRVRHSKMMTQAAAFPDGSGVHIVFEEPVRAPTPGQSAVMYDGDTVLGGGYII